MKEKKTVRQWIGEHKEQIVMSALAVGSFALGYYICKGRAKTPKIIEKGLDLGEMPAKPYQGIDERVFTEFAPWLEEAILAEGVDEDILMDQLKVPFPKGGDWKNGTYEVVKDILILVRDAGNPIKDSVERMQELAKAGAETK